MIPFNIALSPDLPLLLLEFGIMLVILGFVAKFAHKFNFSAVPIYLLAGLLIGSGGFYNPNGLGSIFEPLSEMGAIILLLLLGLEYSGSQLVGSARKQPLTAVIDFLLNTIPGFIAGFVFGWGIIGAVTLAGITYISSSGIVSQVLRDFRWRNNPETAPIVNILIAEDIVMAPFLPVLTVMLTGTGLISGLISTSIALLIVAIVLFISVRSKIKFNRILNATEPVGLLLIVFGAAVAAAGLAGLFSFSGAVAAFLVGLLLTGEVAEVARRRLDPLREVLTAVFFVYFGYSTNTGELLGSSIPAFILAFVTVATKMITGWYAGKLIGANTVSRIRAGALLSARGEFSIIIAGLAAASTQLPDNFQALVSTYVIITAIIASLFARFAEPIGSQIEDRIKKSKSQRKH